MGNISAPRPATVTYRLVLDTRAPAHAFAPTRSPPSHRPHPHQHTHTPAHLATQTKTKMPHNGNVCSAAVIGGLASALLLSAAGATAVAVAAAAVEVRLGTVRTMDLSS